jgi:hypothetical protein
MNANEEPQDARPGAGEKTGYSENSLFSPACQVYLPIPWLIRSNFIENLVSRPYTAKNSLRVDGLLICAEFLEGVGYVWN